MVGLLAPRRAVSLGTCRSRTYAHAAGGSVAALCGVVQGLFPCCDVDGVAIGVCLLLEGEV
jgi:hypothetical protein